MSCKIFSNGEYSDLLNTSGGVSLNQKSGYIHMEGREIFKLGVNKMSDAILQGLNDFNLDIKDINLLIPHQANKRIIVGIGKKLNLNENQVIVTIEEQANTSAGSIPLAIDYVIKNNKIKTNDIVILEALGGGITWGSIVLKW